MEQRTPAIDEIYLAALELNSPEDRSAYLDQVCAANTELRRRVERLLEAHQNVDSFLESPAPEVDRTVDLPPQEGPGMLIGPYKLLEQIGEGGMGTVFMAEQSQPVKRRVALKIIKPGMDSRQVIARFEAERQALAMMDHPNIAKVLDAGTTSGGRPFFVMELVNGIPVTQFCDQQHLTARERLELFLPICQAVQHAHQKGIIHRDIKPSNLLVALYDGRPVPKVIDFGVAKATSQRLTDKTMFTGLGQIVGTLEYMSPEQTQRNQLDVDTRSDVYSLGAVLYELLTGDTPFDKKRLRSAAMDEMLRIIREEEPPRPSTKLSSSNSLASVAANRHVEPLKLTAMLRGELDWIVMKSMEKDRARRYESASSFAADISHYLNNETVNACPPSAGYRFKKFARRNRIVLATGALITATLVLGIIGTGWQAIRATRAEGIAQSRLVSETKARNDAEDARNNEKTQRGEAERERNKASDEATRAKAVLDVMLHMLGRKNDKAYTVNQMLVDFSQAIPDDLQKQPDVLGEVHAAIGQAFIDRNSLLAKKHIQEGLRLRKMTLGQEDPRYAASLIHYAEVLWIWDADLAQAEALCRQALTVLKNHPTEIDLHLRAFRNLAQSLSMQGSHQAVEDVKNEAFDYGKENHIVNNFWLASMLSTYSGSRSSQGDFVGAEAALEQALAMNYEIEGADTEIGWESYGLALVEEKLGKLDEAEKHARESLFIFERHYDFEINASWILSLIENLLERQGRSQEFQQLLQKTPESVVVMYWTGKALEASSQGDLIRYRGIYRELMQKCDNSADPLSLNWATFACTFRPEAIEDLAPAIELARRQLTIKPEPTWGRTVLGALLYRSGDLDDALTTLVEGERLAKPEELNFYDGCRNTLRWFYLGLTYCKKNELSAGIQWISKAEESWQAIRQDPSSERHFSAEEGPHLKYLLSQLHAEVLRTVAELALEHPELTIEFRTSLAPAYSELAETARIAGKYEQAVALYSRVVELDPQNAERYQQRGDVYLASGRLAEAAADFEKALELSPKDLSRMEMLADCLVKLGRLDEAIPKFSQVIDQDSKNVSLWMKRGALYRSLKRYDESLADYSQAIVLDPKNTGAYFERSQLHVHQFKNFDAGLADATKSIEIAPTDRGTWTHRGNIHDMAGQFEAAIADYDKALELVPSDMTVLMSRAKINEKLGRLADAVADFDKAIEASPGNSELYLARAEFRGRAGRRLEAIDDFNKYINTNPQHAGALRQRGQVYCQLKQFPQAIEDFRSAATIEPKNTQHTLARLGAMVANGDETASNAELDQILNEAVDPNHVWVLYGMELLRSGLLEQMEQAVAQSMDRFPETESIMNYNLGCGYALMGETDKAFAALDRAIELGVGRRQMFVEDADLVSLRGDRRFTELLTKLEWSTWFTKGLGSFRAGNFSTAAGEFSQAIKLNPDFVVLWQWRGTALGHAGQSEAAEADFEHYLQVFDQRVSSRPDAWQVLTARGVAKNQIKRWSAAVDDFDAAIKVAPDERTPYRGRAEAFCELEHWESARADLQRAIELGDKNWQTFYFAALLALREQDQPGYRRICESMLITLKNSDDPRTKNFVAWTCSLGPDTLTDWTVAIDLARQAAKSAPDSLQFRNTLGTILFRAGKFDEAIGFLNSVLESSPEQVVEQLISAAYPSFILAMVQQRLGQSETAQQTLATALACATAPTSGATITWNRKLTLDLFQMEAEGLIRPEANNPTTK